jgi:hypothetical protein
MKLINWIVGLFEERYQSSLENYISKHNPTSVAEVEHLERQYSKYQSRGLL